MAEHTNGSLFTLVLGDEPVVATAIHDGHTVRDRVRPLLALSESERLREQDPFTGSWTQVAPTRLVAGRSRFETDLNRPREKAVYLKPEDAWGLDVWREPPPGDLVEELLLDYDFFYETLHAVLSRLVARHGRVLVLDLHTYNHRREGPTCTPADQAGHPDVNIGTGTMNRDRWGHVVDRFIAELREFDYPDRSLDVRENICFRGGQMSRWIHENFPESVCSIAIEFKKFFMDEWTGEADERQLAAIQAALASTLPATERELMRSVRA